MKSSISRYVQSKLDNTTPAAKKRYTVMLDQTTQERVAELCEVLRVKDTDLLADLIQGATEEALKALNRSQKTA